MNVDRSGGSQDVTVAAFQEVAKEEKQEQTAEKISAQKSAQAEAAENVIRPKTEKKEKPAESRSSKISELKAALKDKRLMPVEQMKDEANKYEQKYPELKSKVLMLLREQIKPGDTEEEILKKLEEFYSDPSLADEALEFLLDTTEGELHQTVQKAKDMLNENKGREITAGRNISEQARAASDKGLGTPSSMRDMYRDITGNPRDAQTLFGELSQKYAFKELTKVTNFLFHSLGADMKAKGSSIPRGELSNLIAEVRTLQAIMGVYKFFQGRMDLMAKMFESGGLEMPPGLTFEAMAKAFMSLAAERYPSSDKVKSQARTLTIDDWILAKIIAFSQFRDSIRELSMSQIYRNLQHRDELFLAIIEALEDLEEEFEEQQEKEGEKGAWEGGDDEEEEKKKEGSWEGVDEIE